MWGAVVESAGALRHVVVHRGMCGHVVKSVGAWGCVVVVENAGCVCHIVIIESTEAFRRVVTMAHVPVGVQVSKRCLGMYGVHILFEYESDFVWVHQAHDKLHGLDEKLLVEWETWNEKST